MAVFNDYVCGSPDVSNVLDGLLSDAMHVCYSSGHVVQGRRESVDGRLEESFVTLASPLCMTTILVFFHSRTSKGGVL